MTKHKIQTIKSIIASTWKEGRFRRSLKMNTQLIKLWKDYYNCLKPRCLDCLQQGITENEYKFCSTEKKPSPVYDAWGKLIHVFNDIYACNSYHWTIYQGQNKITRKSISE